MHDRNRPRLALIGLIVLLVASLLAGCGGRNASADTPSLLPRLTVKIDDQGVPSVFGISLSEIGKLLRMDMTAYQVPQPLVQQLMAGDIQHVEVVIADRGVFLFANGQPLPYIATDEEAWATIKELLVMFQVPNQDAINWVLDKVVPRFGIQLAVRFPVAEGAAEIPLREKNSLPQVAVDDARAAVSERSLVLLSEVALDANGVPAIAGVSMDQIQTGLQAAGMAVDLSAARLDPGMIAMLTTAGVQHLQLETEPEGLYLYLNGKRMPRIAWDATRLENAVDLYKRYDPASPYLPLVDVLLPGIQPADVELTVFLPKSSDSEDVPLSDFMGIQ